MDIIIKERGHGKTTDLVNMSAQTGIPIVAFCPSYIISLAKKLNLQIPCPISVASFMELDEKPKSIYIDNMTPVIRMLLGSWVAGFTDSPSFTTTEEL